MPSLFRDEVVQRKFNEIGVPLGISGLWMKFYAMLLLIVLLAGALVATLGSYARKARVSGFLVPEGGLFRVMPLKEGRITEQLVAEDAKVARDQPLFVMDVAAVSAEGRTADLVAASLRDKKRLIELELKRLDSVQASERDVLDARIDNLRAQIAALKTEIDTRIDFIRLMQNDLERNVVLEKKDVYSTAQKEKSEQNLVAARIQLINTQEQITRNRGDLAQAEAERRGLRDKQDNERSLQERNLLEINQQLYQIEEQRFLVVRAPQAGTATGITAHAGMTTNTGTPLVTIIPDQSRLVAYLYVPSSAAGFVKTGAAVKLRYEAYPYQKFGVQDARVIAISHTSVDPKEFPFALTSNEPLYQIIAELSKSTVTAYGVEEELKPGAKFAADLILEERKLWEWAIEPLLAAKAAL